MHKLIVKGGKGGNVDMGYKGKSLFYWSEVQGMEE